MYRATHDSAIRLARTGINVIRFDYTGTGNSSEPPDTLSIDLWQSDIDLVVKEMTEISGCSSNSALTARLGALVAMSREQHFSRIAMLDPVVNGSSFVRTLDKMHKQMCSNSYKYLNPPDPAKLSENEKTGHAVSSLLLNEIADLDLANADGWPAKAAVVCSAESHLNTLPGNIAESQLELLPFDCRWENLRSLEEMLNPAACLRRLESFLTEV